MAIASNMLGCIASPCPPAGEGLHGRPVKPDRTGRQQHRSDRAHRGLHGRRTAEASGFAGGRRQPPQRQPSNRAGHLDVDAGGTVLLQRDDSAGSFGACTDDYNPYRLVGAIDRDRVPDSDALPTENVAGVPEGPGAVVTAYPATGG